MRALLCCRGSRIQVGLCIPTGGSIIDRNRTTYRVVTQQLRAHVHLIAGIIALVIVSTGVSLVSPLLVKRLIDDAIPARDVSLIALLLVGIIAFPLITMALGAVQNYLRASIGEAVSQSLRRALFNHVLYVRIQNLERIASGRIVHTITKVCGEIGEMYVSNELLPMFTNAVLLLGTLVVMFFLNSRLLLVGLLVIPFIYLFAHWMREYAEGLDREYIQVLERGMIYLQEVIPGIRTVRAHTATLYEAARWLEWLKVHWRTKAKSITFHNLVLTLPLDFMQNVGVGLVFGYGAYEVVNGRLEIGGLVAFIMLVQRGYMAVEVILSGHISTGRAKAAAERIDPLLALPCEENSNAAQGTAQTLARTAVQTGQAADRGELGIAQTEQSKQSSTESSLESDSSVHASTSSARTDKSAAKYAGTDVGSGGAAIEFADVSFDYGRDGFGLEDVSFRIEPGSFVGVVGLSGGGKSTVIDLLMRFYEPLSGAIRVDGTDIAALSLSHLRGMIGLVPQDVFLWNDSIYANLVYPAREVSRERVIAAAKAVQLHDFVETLPEGYDTQVGELGLALSGGERQRLALCRAIIELPRILLLDEATSALDALTDRKVRDALETARRGRTTIVVAHRLVTVMHADKILVLDEGRLVQEGAPQSLLAQPGLFQDLYEAQRL